MPPKSQDKKNTNKKEREYIEVYGAREHNLEMSWW